MLLPHTFKENEDGVYLHTRSDGKLRAKTKVRHVTIREVLFADDTAKAKHTEESLQRLIDCFALACDDFGLTISLKNTVVMGQGTTASPSVHIGNQVLNAVERFKYIGSTISSNFSPEPEISSRIAKASAVMLLPHAFN